MDELTESDLEMVRYFLEEKGDVTRWIRWEEKKPLFAKHFPELIAALDALNVAERTLRAVVKAMELPSNAKG